MQSGENKLHVVTEDAQHTGSHIYLKDTFIITGT